MTQKYTKEVARLLNKIDRNTRALAKLTSARAAVLDDDTLNMAHQALVTDRIDGLVFNLVQERRNFRAAFEDELHRQQGWQKVAP